MSKQRQNQVLWLGSRLKILLSACLLAGTALAGADEVVYDNTDSIYYQLGDWYPQIREYGNQVVLAGDARTITRFDIDYFGQFTPTGGETVKVRFYANDATPETPGVYSSAPGTMLFESADMHLADGYNTLSLKNLHVRVPDSFTWTVQFSGLAGVYKNRAGLLFTTTPAVGGSFNDFWQHDPTGWNTYLFNSTSADFTARVYAQSETPLTIQSIKRHGSENQLSLYGSAFTGVALESTTDFVNWTQLDSLTLLGAPVAVFDSLSTNEFFRFYRLRQLDMPIVKTTDLALNTNNSSMLVKMQGAPGWGVSVQATTNNVDWTELGTEYFTSLHTQFVDFSAATNNYLAYRAVPVTNDVMLMVSSTSIAPGKRIVLLAGPPGRDCVIETSDNLQQWSPAGTNTFSFYSGDVHFLDMEAPGARFYRARILPLME